MRIVCRSVIARSCSRRGPGRSTVGVVHQPPAGVDHAVRQVRRHESVVERHELAGRGIELRVRGERGQRPVEVVAPDRLERRQRDLVTRTAEPPEREQPPVVEHEVGVGGVLERTARVREVGTLVDAGPQRVPGRGLDRERLGGHVPVAVHRVAVLEVQRVEHAVAVEPVVPTGWVVLRVRAVADEHAGQVVGQLPDHLAVGGDLGVDRCERTFEVRARHAVGPNSFTAVIAAPRPGIAARVPARGLPAEEPPLWDPSPGARRSRPPSAGRAPGPSAATRRSHPHAATALAPRDRRTGAVAARDRGEHQLAVLLLERAEIGDQRLHRVARATSRSRTPPASAAGVSVATTTFSAATDATSLPPPLPTRNGPSGIIVELMLPARSICAPPRHPIVVVPAPPTSPPSTIAASPSIVAVGKLPWLSTNGSPTIGS